MGDVNSDKLKVTIENFETEPRLRRDSLMNFGNPQHLKIEED